MQCDVHLVVCRVCNDSIIIVYHTPRYDNGIAICKHEIVEDNDVLASGELGAAPHHMTKEPHHYHHRQTYMYDVCQRMDVLC